MLSDLVTNSLGFHESRSQNQTQSKSWSTQDFWWGQPGAGSRSFYSNLPWTGSRALQRLARSAQGLWGRLHHGRCERSRSSGLRTTTPQSLETMCPRLSGVARSSGLGGRDTPGKALAWAGPHLSGCVSHLVNSPRKSRGFACDPVMKRLQKLWHRRFWVRGQFCQTCLTSPTFFLRWKNKKEEGRGAANTLLYPQVLNRLRGRTCVTKINIRGSLRTTEGETGRGAEGGTRKG